VSTIKRLFFSTFEFDKQWNNIGLDDEDRRKLENEIINNPKIGVVIPGTKGLRKMRFASDDKGKRGGSRVLYVDFVVLERIYLITVYPKNQRDDISNEEKKLFNRLIKQTITELGGKTDE
jgi:hypothetical protein